MYIFHELLVHINPFPADYTMQNYPEIFNMRHPKVRKWGVIFSQSLFLLNNEFKKFFFLASLLLPKLH